MSKFVRNSCDAENVIVYDIVSNLQACTFDLASWASSAYTYSGWALTGNEEDLGAWPASVTGDGNLRVAAQFKFQDATVKNHSLSDRTQDPLSYNWNSNLNGLYALAALNDATIADLCSVKITMPNLFFGMVEMIQPLLTRLQLLFIKV